MTTCNECGCELTADEVCFYMNDMLCDDCYSVAAQDGWEEDDE